MATPEVLQSEGDVLLPASFSVSEHSKGETATSRGLLIEKKIEFLESLTGKVHLFPFRYLCLKQVFYYLWLCFSLTIITERKMGSWMHMVHQ